MSIESFNHALPYFFEQRIRGKGISVNSPELLPSEIDSAEIEDMLESTLRLADGGGQMPDPGRMLAGSNSKLSGAVR